MNEEQEKEFDKFLNKWFVERFAKQALHIDDLRELVNKLLKEERNNIKEQFKMKETPEAPFFVKLFNEYIDNKFKEIK